MKIDLKSMLLQVQQQSLLLGRRPSGFTEHYYMEWDDGLGKEKILLFLVLSITSTQVPGPEIGKEIFQLLQDHFLDDLSGDPYDRFEGSLREINLMINQKEKELGVKFIPNMHVVAGVIQKDLLFLSQRGEAQGYLIRKRHVSSVTEGLCDEKNKEDLFQNIASGVLEVNDSVVLVTGPLIQHVTPNDLSKIFSEQSIGEAVKELEDLLHQDLEDQMALLSFEVLEKSEDLIGEVSKEDQEFEEESGGFSSEMEDEPLPQGRATLDRLKMSLQILREWTQKQDRWAFLDRVRQLDKRQLIIAIVGVFLLLVVGIFVLQLTVGKQRAVEAMQSRLDMAESNITQAETRGTFDKAEANDLLNQAEVLAIEVLDSGYLGGHASQLLDKITEQRDYLDNVVHVDDELKLLVDFTDLLGTGSIQGFEAVGDGLLVYTASEAYPVLLDQVQSSHPLAPGELVLSGHYFSDADAIVMLTEAGSILEYTDGNAQFSDNSDGNWHSGIEVGTYSNKLYILDPESSQIWRYSRGTNAYGSAQAYFSEGDAAPDLSEAVSMSIDGSVWVLKKDGEIAKFLSGAADEFLIKKAPLGAVQEPTRIYTELDLSQLYVLDPKAKRVYVYDKSLKTGDLTYNAQYVFDDVKGMLQDLYFDKEKDVLLLVTDQALYELSF